MHAVLPGFMCNVICSSFQVHPRTLLGAACCPLCWWVVSYRESSSSSRRRDTILHVLHTHTHTHSSPSDNNSGAVMWKECWEEEIHGAAECTLLMLLLSNAVSLLLLSLAIRERSRGHARGRWRRKLANSARWRATVGDTLPSLLLRLLHRLLGFWEPQVRTRICSTRVKKLVYFLSCVFLLIFKKKILIGHKIMFKSTNFDRF